ncbi:MAG: pseudouridine synthase [Coriobacteriia bacterium]
MTPEPTTPTNEPERLQRYLARAGVASRRSAEEMIAAGRVRVNGEVVTAMGVKVVSGTDRVEVDGAVVAPLESHVYFVLNKPAGYVTTLSDPEGRKTVADLLPNVGRRLFTVGRLDYETTGLLLLTDDGEFAHRLMHPRYHVEKSYIATVAGIPDEPVLQRLRSGVTLDDGLTAPAEAERIATRGDSATVRLVIREGRKRQVRRMLASVGHPVFQLHRERFGPVLLGGVAPGETRPLEAAEVAALMAAAATSAKEK